MTDQPEPTKQAEAEVIRLVAELEEQRRLKEQAEAKVMKYNIALCNLTPGGSEFANDPDACVRYVHEARHSQFEIIKSFKRTRDELQAKLATAEARYMELLYAVAQKWPNESRHETALRYIREREQRSQQYSGQASAASPHADTKESG